MLANSLVFALFILLSRNLAVGGLFTNENWADSNAFSYDTVSGVSGGALNAVLTNCEGRECYDPLWSGLAEQNVTDDDAFAAFLTVANTDPYWGGWLATVVDILAKPEVDPPGKHSKGKRNSPPKKKKKKKNKGAKKAPKQAKNTCSPQSSSVDAQLAISKIFYTGNYSSCQRVGVFDYNDDWQSWGEWEGEGSTKWTLELLPNIWGGPPEQGLALQLTRTNIAYYNGTDVIPGSSPDALTIPYTGMVDYFNPTEASFHHSLSQSDIDNVGNIMQANREIRVKLRPPNTDGYSTKHLNCEAVKLGIGPQYEYEKYYFTLVEDGAPCPCTYDPYEDLAMVHLFDLESGKVKSVGVDLSSTVDASFWLQNPMQPIYETLSGSEINKTQTWAENNVTECDLLTLRWVWVN